MVITACFFIQPALSADRWIAPTAVGKKDGTSPANAASPSSINTMVRAAGAGGRVIFITDRGSYKGSGLTIYAGGQSGRPVTITGLTSGGKPARAMIYGTGERYFNLYSGANYVTISNFNFESFGQGVIYIGAALKGVNIENVDATKIRKLVDMPSTASLDGFTFRNLTSRKFSKAFIQLRNAVNGLITDVNIDSARTDGDPLPFGVHADGNTRFVTIRNMVVKNILYSYGGDPYKYWNGDGISTESATYGIRIENVRVEGSSDAAFDLKGGTSANPHVVVNSSGYNVKRGLRVWGITQADNVRISALRMPSTVINGKTVSQSYGPGGTTAVWMKAGSTLRYRNIYLDNVKIATPTFDQRDGKSSAIAY
jgi:hypothetical protein